MTATTEEIDSFHRFATERMRNGGGDLTMDQLYDHWRAENPTDQELEESLQALKRGLADMKAGRIHPAEEVMELE